MSDVATMPHVSLSLQSSCPTTVLKSGGRTHVSNGDESNEEKLNKKESSSQSSYNLSSQSSSTWMCCAASSRSWISSWPSSSVTLSTSKNKFTSVSLHPQWLSHHLSRASTSTKNKSGSYLTCRIPVWNALPENSILNNDVISVSSLHTYTSFSTIMHIFLFIYPFPFHFFVYNLHVVQRY